MACYHPLTGWRAREPSPSGKYRVVFTIKEAFLDLPITIPCGQCVGCRLERSRQWAIRCMHEASLYSDNSFITLTFDDTSLETVAPDHSLNVRHFQLFMKKLRKKYGQGIRFYHCGEYGETYGRPHYHACLFNFDFPDKQRFRVDRGNTTYTSAILNDLWGHGFCLIGDVTFQSAAYVARYIMKKVNGDAAGSHYQYIHPISGEIIDRSPEYTTMSRRPGIGKNWLDKYMYDIYPSDFVVLNNKKMRPPKFYDNQFEIAFPEDYAILKSDRKRSLKKHSDNNTSERLYVREQVQLAKLTQLKRTVN